MKLFTKISFFLLALIGVSLWASLYFSGKAVRETLGKLIAERAASAAAEGEAGFIKALASGREKDGIKALYEYKQRSGAICSGILTRDYKILAHTNVAMAGSVAEMNWAGLKGKSLIYRRTSFKGEEVVEALIPLHSTAKYSPEGILFEDESGDIPGFVWAVLSLNPAIKAEQDISSRLYLITGMIALFTLLISAGFIRLQLRQVELLSEGIRKIREGDLAWEVPVRTSDEIGELAGFFNEMIGDLRVSKELLDEYQEDLEKKVEQRTRELESSQERLLQAGKMAAVGQLVSGVAHELNNPLTGVSGYAQLMLRDPGLSARQREDLEVILSQAARAKGIIQNLLHFSRKGESKREVVSVTDLLESSLKLVNYNFSSSGIRLEREFQAGLPSIMGDPSQLQQVFLNIISNARDAMTADSGGRLLITAKTEGGKVRVGFSDTGAGIAKENLDRIFDPFFTTKPAGKGTGLGLSISYEIIKRHNGTINAESGPGRGTTFTIELPVMNEDL